MQLQQERDSSANLKATCRLCHMRPALALSRNTWSIWMTLIMTGMTTINRMSSSRLLHSRLQLTLTQSRAGSRRVEQPAHLAIIGISQGERQSTSPEAGTRHAADAELGSSKEPDMDDLATSSEFVEPGTDCFSEGQSGRSADDVWGPV